jgi:hypothetical protein
LTAKLDIGFVYMPSSSDGSLPEVEALQQHRRETNAPAVDRRMTDVAATL